MIGQLLRTTALLALVILLCHEMTAQDTTFHTSTCVPNNNLTSIPGPITIVPAQLYPGQDATGYIVGQYPVGANYSFGSCTQVNFDVLEWTGYPDPKKTGNPASNVNISDLQYVSSHLTTFHLSVSSAARVGDWVAFILQPQQSALPLSYWGFFGMQVTDPTLPPGPGPDDNLFLVDPYLIPNAIPTGIINPSDITPSIDNAPYEAEGIIADGTSTAVAVYETAYRSDVKFTATNGAMVGAFNNNFLMTKPSGHDTNEYTVPAVELQSARGKYYAMALVQSPGSSQAVTDDSGDVVVTAQRAGGPIPLQQRMTLYPPSVILAHGIWADPGTLTAGPNNVQDYLINSGGYSQDQLIPICYTSGKHWYAPSDGPGAGGTCQSVSYDAINYALEQEVYPKYDLYHIVGGRVDVVAHSMGGLAARNYAGPAKYLTNVRSRYSGAIHTLITLDTPEQGSGIAQFVSDHATDKEDPHNSLLSARLWGAAGCAKGATLQDCMGGAKLNEELADPGAPVESGAMYSLRPTIFTTQKPSLTFDGEPYTVPDVPPNATWIAIGGTFPDLETFPSVGLSYPRSLLRAVLGNLIAAIYPANKSPSLNSDIGPLGQCIGGEAGCNDVIVPYSSEVQTADGTGPAFTYSLVNLQHTSTPPLNNWLWLINTLTPPTGGGDFKDPDVTHDLGVNADILYSLQYGAPK